MKVKSFWGSFWRLFGNAKERNPLGILAENEFKHILEYERALSDRHERHFSLLLFSPEGTGEQSLFFARLVDILRRRLRMTDVVGWVAGDRVGVLLPYSNHAGARVVGDDVAAELASISFRARCEVHTYPCEEGAQEGDGGGPGSVDFTKGYPAPRVLAGGGEEAETSTGGRRIAMAPVVLPKYDLCDGFSCELMQLIVAPPPMWKRALDILIAGVGILVTSPVWVTTAVFIKMVSPGPVFFKQERVGHLGRLFMCWKFRTMHVRADSSVHQQHLSKLMETDTPMTKLDKANDARLIPLGRFLRASGIDELPQLVNVLRGDMSFVGPRPCIHYEYKNYQRWHKQRFDTLPGLTGLWQVSGKNRTTFSQMMRLDVSYARNASLGRDLNIVWRTFPVLVSEVQNLIAQRKGRNNASS